MIKQSGIIEKRTRARRADHVDAEVGRRVKARRLERDQSQSELADQIGVTFQQVQKYERGVNRIGASRLQKISEALEVPITFFFAGPVRTALPNAAFPDSVVGKLQTLEAVRLIKAFNKIRSRKARQLIVFVSEELAADQAGYS
jgi:transcriptional regulator with XRE-family HTH domain